jgi:hypothetical protein
VAVANPSSPGRSPRPSPGSVNLSLLIDRSSRSATRERVQLRCGRPILVVLVIFLFLRTFGHVIEPGAAPRSSARSR